MHMKQLCNHPAPICPSTDPILQLDITLPHIQGGEEREEEEEKREVEVGRQTKQPEEEELRGGGQHSSHKTKQEKVNAVRTWPLVR